MRFRLHGKVVKSFVFCCLLTCEAILSELKLASHSKASTDFPFAIALSCIVILPRTHSTQQYTSFSILEDVNVHGR